jgi:hypothetical protein
MKIWENFEKKDLIKGNDFPNQLIYEKEGTLEDFDFNITYDKSSGMILINWGNGYIEITLQEFIKGVF